MPHRPSVLIADDSKMTRLMVEKLLPSVGYRCFSVASARECLEVIDSVSFDAIITDLEMPGMSGFELLEELKSRPETANIPILVLTADQERETLQEAFSLGAADFLRKPVDKLELLARVGMATQMSRELKRRRENERELQLSLTHLRRDLEAAGRLQRSMLPKNNAIIGGLEIAWHFSPCEDIGGDVLNYFRLNDREVGLYLLDVAGHGVSSALNAMAVNSTMLSNNSPGGLLVGLDGRANPPHEVVGALNNLFPMDLESNKYFTFAYFVIDLIDHTIRYTQAGHPPPLAIVDGETVPWNEGDLPVGMLPNTKYETHSRSLKPGTRVVLYSDGITEAVGPGGELLGEERFISAIKAKHKQPLASLVKHVVLEADRWMAGIPAHDDISLIAFEVAPETGTSSLTVPSTLDAVRDLASGVRLELEKSGYPEPQATMVELVVTEAATNIVKHGYQQSDEGEITMHLIIDGRAVRIALVDSSPEFNPLTQSRDLKDWSPDLATDTSAGMGLGIIESIADKVEYMRVDDQNRLIITIKQKDDLD